MIEDLLQWLDNHDMQYDVIDDEVIEIVGAGMFFVEDTSKMKSIFRKGKDDDVVFNGSEHPQSLINEGVNYVALKFGNNWYYSDLRGDFKMRILKYLGNRKPTILSTEYVHLGVHTPFELLNGSFLIDQWVNKCNFLKHSGLGICDKNTMAGCYALQKECDAKGVQPIFGYSLTFTDGVDKVGAKVYVQTQQGLRNLLRIQKAIMVDSEDKTIPLSELMNRGEGNVLVLDKYASHWMLNNPVFVRDLRQSFQHVLYQVDLSEYKAERIDIKVLDATKTYFHKIYGNSNWGVAPVLIADTYYLDKSDAKNKIILNKIAEGAAHEQSDDQYYKSIDEHWATFSSVFDADNWDVQSIFQECCEWTIKIASGAKARFENTRNFMPKYNLLPEEEAKYGNARNMFHQLLEDGLQRLIPQEHHEKYRKQMEYEKYIIESTNNVDYLLVQYDTCNWARANNILVGCGRGSAAGSLLLYLLGVTLIDPIKYDLIFERFLLPERAGLYSADVSLIDGEIDSRSFVDVELADGITVKIDQYAELMVERNGEDTPIKICAIDLMPDDNILFDNRDILFTLKTKQ